MSRISELGDEILQLQSSLGVPNAANLQAAMSARDLAECPLFSGVPVGSELHDLFRWRNGVVDDSTIPMGKLWFVPGYYLISAQEAVLMNKYIAENPLPSWSSTWFPLLRSGSADLHFFEKPKICEDRVPIYYSDTEMSESPCQKYDSIESPS